MLRHYAQIKNTGSRVLVVFMKLPDDEKNCLLLSLDTMNDILRDEVREIVDSKEGQAETDLYKLLSRKTLRAGDAGVSALNWLHAKRFLFKAPITDVVMTPSSQYRIDLTDLLKQLEDLEANKDKAEVLPKAMSPQDLEQKVKSLEVELSELRAQLTKKDAKEDTTAEKTGETKPKRPYNKKIK